jgi:L-iditol 2-dehydrogenase
MLVALARREGWDVIGVEPVPERAELARAFGARQVLRPDAGLVEGLRAAAPPFGPDAALAATDADAAVDAALRSVRPGGAVMLFGHTRLGQPLTVDGGQIGVAEKRLLGSYSSSVDLNDAVREILLDAAMPWARLVTHLMPLGDINRALGLARHPEAGSLKIAVTALAAPKGGA